MKKLLKLMLALVLSLGLVACSSSNSSDDTTTEEETTEEAAIGAVKVLCPTGAPGIALANAYQDIEAAGGSVTFCDGTDELIAQLTNADSEYNVIIAPINLGCKLAAAGQSEYKLQAVLTWGNLYLVGTSEDALQGTGEIALFGEGAVPAKIYSTVGVETTLTPTFYESAQLVQQELLTGKAQVGMLAEPAATATIAKAKEAGIELSIISDLQELYGEDGYPQAAVFVKGDVDTALMDNMNEFTNNGYPELETLLDTIGIDNFGLPSTAVVVKSIDRQNIHYTDASECTEQITDFLKLFNIEFSDDMLAA